MDQAIILHGMPEPEELETAASNLHNMHWLPWLREQLIARGVNAVTPAMPRPHNPQWEAWLQKIKNYVITTNTALVGHSGGAGFWIRYISENSELEVGKLVLVAPWLDPDGDETDGFFDFDIDPKLINRTKGITIFNSDNDMGNVHKSVAMLRTTIPGIKYREFHKYGHFTESDMGSKEFPELLEELFTGKP
jgi:uncharacterized protein